MATPTVVLEQELMFGQWDFTAQVTAFAEAGTTAELDASALKDLTTIMEPGLKGYGLSGSALWQGDDENIDDVLFDQQRVRNIPVTLALVNGAAGSKARSFQAMIGEYGPGAGHGELLKLDFAFGAMAKPIDGNLLFNTSASGNVTGTAFEFGAIAADETLYGALHVFGGTGEFIVTIQSDDVENFAGTPETQITFSTIATGTPRAFQWSINAGAVTDTWWRVTATNPNTRDFAVFMGIR